MAEGIRRLESSLLSPNLYLLTHADDRVLVDAGTRRGADKILRQIDEQPPRVLLLTHVHPPTQGASTQLCRQLGLELWCGAGDELTAVTGMTAAAQPRHVINRLQQRLLGRPGYPVSRTLHEGDSVVGFVVLEVPGHSPGHIALRREHDRVLILGDVINGHNVWTMRPGLHEPPRVFTPDPSENRRSAKRLAALRPELVLFSHGPPLRDPDALLAFASRLPMRGEHRAR